MMRRLFFTSLLIFSLAIASAAQSPSTAEDYFKSSLARSQRGDFKGAIADLDKVIALKKDFAAAYSSRGGMKLLTGDLDGSLADLNRAIELEPNFKPAYQNRAHVRRQKGDYEGALADFDKSIALGWMIREAYIGRGNVKMDKKDYDGAIEDFGAVIALDPKSPVGYMNRGVARRAKGDTQGAMADTNMAIQLGAPDSDSFVVKMGDSNQEVEADASKSQPGKKSPELIEKRTTTGVFALPDAVEMKSGASVEMNSPMMSKIAASMSYLNRGSELRRQGNIDGAIEDYTKAIETYPFWAAYSNRGAALRDKGDMDGALADFNRAIELSPQTAFLYLERGALRLAQGDEAAAQKDFDKTLKLDPSLKTMLDTRVKSIKAEREAKQP
ncbi:MAG TPA: tetratricopeptide repeat protein [Pyrinomonadaceae bacterium]|nr:tetratricopeptide repeat protein [Pyrinomonadaceae bacterium]